MPLNNKEQFIIREIDVEVVGKTLKLTQKLSGDVNCVVWDASIVLAKYLEELERRHCHYFTDKTVLELGAGVGYGGLTAACLGAHVTLTDLPEYLELLELNVKENNDQFKGTATVKPLIWGQNLDFLHPNLILIADCIYYRESIDPLIDTLKTLSDNKTEIFLSQELRESEIQQANWNYFMENIKNSFKIKEIPLEEQNEEFRSRDILLFRLIKH